MFGLCPTSDLFDLISEQLGNNVNDPEAIVATPIDFKKFLLVCFTIIEVLENIVVSKVYNELLINFK